MEIEKIWGHLGREVFYFLDSSFLLPTMLLICHAYAYELLCNATSS